MLCPQYLSRRSCGRVLTLPDLGVALCHGVEVVCAKEEHLPVLALRPPCSCHTDRGGGIGPGQGRQTGQSPPQPHPGLSRRLPRAGSRQNRSARPTSTQESRQRPWSCLVYYVYTSYLFYWCGLRTDLDSRDAPTFVPHAARIRGAHPVQEPGNKVTVVFLAVRLEHDHVAISACLTGRPLLVYRLGPRR